MHVMDTGCLDQRQVERRVSAAATEGIGANRYVGISPHFPKRAEEPDDRTIQPVPAPRRRVHWTAQAGRPGASAYDTSR
jgi:hypothetical protein